MVPNAGRHADQVIAALAARQHGVVARAQVLRAGVSGDLLDHRLRTGRLRRLHRGVYGVGPVEADRAREMAAVLACGDGAALSHRSAAAVWRLLPGTPRVDAVDVTVTHGRAGRRRGIRVRHFRTLRPDELTIVDAIPITTAARTLYDLAGMVGSRSPRGSKAAPCPVLVSRRELERAVAESYARGLVHRATLLRLADRHATRPGAGRLRRLLEGGSRLLLTRSEAEERFLALVRKARLPDPDANSEVVGLEVDFIWRAERLVVEVDGRSFHAADWRFENDRRRGAILVAAGYRVMRVTWLQIMREPEALLVRLAGALARTA